MRLFSCLNYFRNESNVKTVWMRFNEHEPILFVHDITPSLSRGSRLTDYRAKYITRPKIFQSKIHKGIGDGNSSLEQRGLEKIFSV